MRTLCFLSVLFLFSSCWTKPRPRPRSNPYVHVWGNKAVYTPIAEAKSIAFIDGAQPVVEAGNIYTKGDFIYQLEYGKGIHVIDNSTPSQAHRIGFITINGSSQVSIKDNYLYSNSYDDLVVVDITDLHHLTEVNRVAGAFPEGNYNYFYSEPNEPGYYECPRYDSVITGWVKDSIWTSCQK